MPDPLARIQPVSAAADNARLTESSLPAAPAGAKPAEAAETRPAQAASAETRLAPASEASSGLQLRYRIDQDTQKLTVLMVDATAHRVIRTIPSEELQRLDPGDLLELWA